MGAFEDSGLEYTHTIALAEVGVFMGDTCSSLLEHGLPVSVIHLVDPWLTADEVFKAVKLEKKQTLSGPAARAHVEQRFSALAPTYGFDGVSPEMTPYHGPALTRDGPWPSARLLQGSAGIASSVKVGIHATKSAVATDRIADASLDIVYLDGAHDFENVLLDIRVWWP